MSNSVLSLNGKALWCNGANLSISTACTLSIRGNTYGSNVVTAYATAYHTGVATSISSTGDWVSADVPYGAHVYYKAVAPDYWSASGADSNINGFSANILPSDTHAITSWVYLYKDGFIDVPSSAVGSRNFSASARISMGMGGYSYCLGGIFPYVISNYSGDPALTSTNVDWVYQSRYYGYDMTNHRETAASSYDGLGTLKPNTEIRNLYMQLDSSLPLLTVVRPYPLSYDNGGVGYITAAPHRTLVFSFTAGQNNDSTASAYPASSGPFTFSTSTYTAESATSDTNYFGSRVTFNKRDSYWSSKNAWVRVQQSWTPQFFISGITK